MTLSEVSTKVPLLPENVTFECVAFVKAGFVFDDEDCIVACTNML